MAVDEKDGVVARASIHAALADPARLRIVERLLAGDASPSEIQDLLSMPSNLVAHHLRVLKNAGVVRRVRSDGDRRRTYLSIDADMLDAMVPRTALHTQRVLFVCTQNSALSQLAAAIWNCHSATAVSAASAGTDPAADMHPEALKTARRHNIPMEARTPRRVEDVHGDGDLVIAVCDAAHEVLLPDLERIHWSIPDPTDSWLPAEFDRAVDELTRRIDYFGSRVHPV
jgi:ArsR family transcriptional regulator, arsenate/arsenite/antimonite-responsive transcriptional repressor / arsenate reductase (thioredoxin)